MAETPGNVDGDKLALTTFRQLTEADVHRLTDAASFARGQSYYRNGYLRDLMLRGDTLQAVSLGSSGGPYRVAATLVPASSPSADALASWECSCPRGDFCKHLVALALAWIDAPEQFVARPAVAAQLTGRSNEELIALIELMLKRQPDLAELLDLPLPGGRREAGQGARLTIDRAYVRGQVAAAFEYDHYHDDWGVAGAIASDLARQRELADHYAHGGEWANAQVIYTAIVQEALDHYDELDDEGEITALIAACNSGLAACLNAQADLDAADRLDEEAREELIETLYAIWQHGLDYDGVDLDAPVPETLARNVTPAERATLEGWLRREIDAGSSAHWKNRGAVRFLVALRGAAGIDDEELLTEYRDAGLWSDAAALLLARGRVDEALALAQQTITTPQPAVAFAQSLQALGGERIGQALAFIEDRLWELNSAERARDSETYLSWLAQQYAAHGLPAKALDMQQRRFRAHPDVNTYEAVKASAQLPGQPTGRWSELRPDLLLLLEERAAWGTLVEIYVREGLVADAFSALAELERGQPTTTSYGFGYSASWGLPSYQLRVAQAAEQDYPARARGLYQTLAEHLIAQRGRENYRTAASYLARVRELYEREGATSAWRDFITALRERHKSLRALKEELNARQL